MTLMLGRIKIFPFLTELLEKYILYIYRIIDIYIFIYTYIYIYTITLLKMYNIHQHLHPKILSDPNNSSSAVLVLLQYKRTPENNLPCYSWLPMVLYTKFAQ